MRAGRRWIRAWLVSAVATLAFATTASAVIEPIDSVTLHSGGGAAAWDPFPSDTGSCVGAAYFAVDDGSFTSGVTQHTDAFDAGLGLYVYSGSAGFVGFRDGNSGDHVGESLTLGPHKVLGIRIARTDRGLAGSPTLRSVVKLTNTTSHKLTRLIAYCSNLGSDDETGVRASSDGDHKFTVADRWAVTSDDATTPGDPVVTHVFSGKGTLRVKKTGLCAPGGGSDCIGQQMRLTLRAHQTRYLLFYAEMHFTNGPAITDVSKYNNKHLTAALLSGISQTVKSRILNWDLG